MIKYTPEQHDVIDHMLIEDGILLVGAGAGTGKTFLSESVVRKLAPRSTLYTAFNKAIVAEGEARFAGLGVTCKTFHALAHSFVKPKRDINDLAYACIKEKISYKDKYAIITAINDFYVSASVDMYEFMQEHLETAKLRSLAVMYIEMMIHEKIDPTFNFMLKYFHIMLANGSVTCKYDLVILDEINDTTAVALEIFKLIQAPKKLGLGETHQAIYDFLNLVNGFEELKDVPILNLTHSFRCSKPVAHGIQEFMRRHVDKQFKFTGTDTPVKNGKTLYCTLTNAKIIMRIQEMIAAGLGFTLLRNISEIFAYPMAITTAGQGKEVYHKKYKFLEDEYKEYIKINAKGVSFYQHLLEYVDDQDTKSAVNLLLHLARKGTNLFGLYKEAKEVVPDPSYTIATVYTSKGLEYETVDIAHDIKSRIEGILDKGGIQSHEDLVAFRCAYVACSRAGPDLRSGKLLAL